MGQLGEWLTGSLDGWLGAIVALATLGGGGYVGGRVAAVARSRHEDRLALLDIAYNTLFHSASNWSGDRKIEILELAMRLPHVDRCIVLLLLDNEYSLNATEPDVTIEVLQFEINPRKLGVVGHTWRKLRILSKSRLGSRSAVASFHNKLVWARQTDPEWGDHAALFARRQAGVDSLY